MDANALGQKKLKKFSNKLNFTFVKGSAWGHNNGTKYYRLFDENNKATVKIGNNESVDLTGILKDTLATISINGSLKEQGTATKTIVTTEEQTSATIEVTAQDGTQENYTVTLVRNSSNNIIV